MNENMILSTLRQGQIEGFVVGTTLTLTTVILSKTVRKAINRIGLTVRQDEDE